MANQIVVSAGAKVRDLQDVIIGTNGVLTSLGFDVANGVPKLDVNGKILVSQLPNSVMEYKGVWNAATNTPTLANGTGNQGDVYLCNVAGTTNFGAGPIAFVVGDQVIYSSVAEGSIWQRASGATGTVTSVALTESGDSLNITGSPITTSGTINIGFNGTNLQYVNGAGNLTTFPTIITSIGLSMPSAFSVANSPLTANGTIAVTGAGTTAQYIRGDGSLATFPTIATEAQRLITEVYNETGATLSKGTVVYINGGHGNLPTITKALATGDATSAQTYGIVQTDITNMNNGYVVVIGSLTDLDTSAYVEGTQLYLSSTTAGAWTSVKQYAPAHLVYVAIVTRSHPTQGVVEVMIQNGFEMDELHNVSAQSPLNNQGLFYNTSTSLWENKSIATALGYTPADDSLVVHLAGTETITGVKNFNIGLTLQTGYYPTPALGYVGLGSNGSGITILTKPVSTVYNNNLQFSAASNTYNFPAASGTIALTSDIPSLAGYVTLATTQTITGAKTFSGYTTFTSTVDITSGLTFSNSGFTLVLQPPTLSVNRTVTFADITGTIAMLEGTQTFTGAKTFTATSLTLAPTSGGGTLNLKQDSFLGATNGYTSLTSSGSDFAIIAATGVSTSKQAVFSLSSLGAILRTYTLPDASGTIALVGGSGVGTVTSVAALTIGTTGTDLSSTVANSTTTPVITLNVPTASATNRGALSSADWTTFNNKQNALTNPVTGTGTTNYLPKFTGTSTIGNSAITDDGSSITLGLGQTTFGTTGSKFYVYPAFSTNLNLLQNYNGSAYTTEEHRASDYSFKIGTTASLTIASTGAATFSSSVSVNTTNAVSTLEIGAVESDGTGSTNAVRIQSKTSPSNQQLLIGINQTGTYSFLQSSQASVGYKSLALNPNGGNVLIGTTTDSGYKLDVNGTGRFTGQTTFGNTLQVTGNANVPASGAGIELAGSTSATGITSFNRTLGTYLASGHNALSYSFAISGVEKFALAASTGAATFSSSVKAGTYLGVAKDGSDTIGAGAYLVLAATSSSRQWIQQLSASQNLTYYHYNGSSWIQPVTFTAGGNVLIGTTTDAGQKLQVNGTLYTADMVTIGIADISTGENKGLRLNNTGSGGKNWNITAGKTGSNNADFVVRNSTTHANVLALDGTSGSAEFISSIYATAFFESSDSRLKTLIQDNYQTKGIASITPKLYTKNGKVELGYYAQDFVGVLDSAVSKGSDDMLSLSYREVHTAKIYALEQEIKELKAKMN